MDGRTMSMDRDTLAEAQARLAAARETIERERRAIGIAAEWVEPGDERMADVKRELADLERATDRWAAELAELEARLHPTAKGIDG